MRLDHLAAADPLGSPPADEQRARAESLLAQFGFVRDGDALVLDATWPWVRVGRDGGLLHVSVDPALPEHLFDQALAALDGLVMEAGLVRIDPLSRAAIEPGEWRRRVAAASTARRRR
jgi:hypothetical protein